MGHLVDEIIGIDAAGDDAQQNVGDQAAVIGQALPGIDRVALLDGVAHLVDGAGQFALGRLEHLVGRFRHLGLGRNVCAASRAELGARLDLFAAM